MLEIHWKEVTVTFNETKLICQELSLQDQIKVGCLIDRKPLLFHLMLKQGITWFTLAIGMQETV